MLRDFTDNILLCTAPVGLLTTDVQGFITEANPYIHSLIEKTSAGDLRGFPAVDLFAPASKLYFQLQLAPLIHLNGGFTEVAMKLRGPKGEQLNVLVNAIRHETGVTYAIFPAEARRRREQDLATLREETDTKNKLLMQIERMASIGAWTIDLQTMVPSWSDEVFTIFDATSGQTLDLDIVLSCFTPEARDAFMDWLRGTGSSAKSFAHESEIVTLNGRRKWTKSSAEVELLEGKPGRAIGVIQDVTEHHFAQDELLWLAHYDPLTGLANRARFHNVLDVEIAKAVDTGLSVSLLLLDLDGFKEINDAYGHDAGDDVLKVVGERLTKMPGSILCGRLGGDEFVILVAGVSEAAVLSAAETVLREVSLPIVTPAAEFHVGVSLGIATFPDDAEDAPDLIKRADLALYEAKSTGKGCAVRFSTELETAFDARRADFTLVKRAAARNSLRPYYQPKVSLETGDIVGFEALARVEMPDGRILTPGDFASALKDDRGALIIHDAILSNLLADLRKWLDSGLEPGEVSFNLADAALREPGFPLSLIRQIEEAGVPANRITIEITETVFLNRDSSRVKSALNDLRTIGCKIALDDFGTGFASLSHLRDFPIDQIKIDRSFVMNQRSIAGNDAIVMAIIGLAKNLRIKVVAEGVETEDQRTFLAAEGCQIGQGYLFGKAIPAGHAALMLNIKPPAKTFQGP
jgi:diguanylate cyclase (GGDEF)-like protein